MTQCGGHIAALSRAIHPVLMHTSKPSCAAAAAARAAPDPRAPAPTDRGAAATDRRLGRREHAPPAPPRQAQGEKMLLARTASKPPARQHAGGRGFGHASLRAHVSTRIERCTRACAGLCGGACTPAASAKWCGLVRALGSQPAPGHDRNRARTLTRTDLKTGPPHQVTAGPSRRVREGQRARVHRNGLATVAPGMAQAWTTCGWR